jgi:tetratricopeptide (TPR) repeat protein
MEFVEVLFAALFGMTAAFPLWARRRGRDLERCHDLVVRGRASRVSGAEMEAEALADRGLHLAERAVGADHPDLVPLLYERARMAVDAGAWESAEVLLVRAVAIDARAPLVVPSMRDVLALLVRVARVRGDRRALARACARRVLALDRDPLVPHAELTAAVVDHARAVREAAEAADAAEAAEAAPFRSALRTLAPRLSVLAMAARARGAVALEAACLVEAAHCFAQLGNAAHALELAGAARSCLSGSDARVLVARAELALAEAAAAAGDRATADEALRRANDVADAAMPSARGDGETLRVWLDAHRALRRQLARTRGDAHACAAARAFLAQVVALQATLAAGSTRGDGPYRLSGTAAPCGAPNTASEAAHTLALARAELEAELAATPAAASAVPSPPGALSAAFAFTPRAERA